MRLKSSVIKKKGKFSNVLKTVNEQKRIKIETKKDNGVLDYVTTHWYLMDNENQLQFQIKGPTNVRIFSRIMFPDQVLNDYYISMRENGIEIGTYYFLTEASDHSYVSDSKTLVSKWRSTWLTVPKGMHHYVFSLPSIENNHDQKTLIRLKEWSKK